MALIRLPAPFAILAGASCGASAQPEQDAAPEPGGARAYGICLTLPRLSGAESRADLGAVPEGR